MGNTPTVSLASLFFFIASLLVCGTGFPVRVESCYRPPEFAARRPGNEENSTAIGVLQVENPFLTASRVDPRLDRASQTLSRCSQSL
jgi:hypothetical protein